MFEQCKLNFDPNALKTCIDAQTVSFHYGKHHATYVANLITFANKARLSEMPLEKLLASLDEITDPTLRTAIRNNGGGVYNHNLYFSTIGTGTQRPQGELEDKINATFGSFEQFKEQISALAVGQFGSGWAFLSVTPKGELVLSACANQDNPIILKTGNTPIFTIDVWEHAYYLKYQNLRAAYVKDFFEIVNWQTVEENYRKALA